MEFIFYIAVSQALLSGHVEDILALSPSVCERLTDFIFTYSDVNYRAKNGAKELTDDAIAHLRSHVPN